MTEQYVYHYVNPDQRIWYTHIHDHDGKTWLHFVREPDIAIATERRPFERPDRLEINGVDVDIICHDPDRSDMRATIERAIEETAMGEGVTVGQEHGAWYLESAP